MSNRICGKCGSRKVADAGSYGGSTFFKCETCGQMGMLEKFPEMTVFHKITASPEVLAETLVYQIFDVYGYEWWTSTLCNYTQWELRAEAIAATVAKLKEVCDA